MRISVPSSQSGEAKQKKEVKICLVLLISLLFVVVGSAGVSAACPAGMVSYWTFDDADNNATGDPQDTVGSNDGTNVGATTGVAGKVGEAFDFDGVDDYVNVGNDSSLDITDAITIGTWVKKSELSRIESILSKGPYSLKIGADNKPYVELIAEPPQNNWTEKAPQLGAETYILSLAVYNGKLYGGTNPNGKLYEWNGVNAWVEKAPKLGAETYIYSLAVYNGKLYGGTAENGKLYEYGSGIAAYSDTAIDNETYSNVAGTYDGATAKIYIAGVLRGNASGSITIDNETYQLLIGASAGSSKGGSSSSGEDYFNGRIDEVAIFNRALNSIEISDLYDLGVAGNGYCAGAATYGNLTLSWISPSASTYVAQNKFWNFSLQLSCSSDGDCGLVNVTLDPWAINELMAGRNLQLDNEGNVIGVEEAETTGKETAGTKEIDVKKETEKSWFEKIIEIVKGIFG